MKQIKRVVAVFAVLAACATAVAAVKEKEWPFAILRVYGSYVANSNFVERVFAAQERHSGLLDELWFGEDGDSFAQPAACGAHAAKVNLAARDRCRALGIAFSYQQGVTLNHGPDDKRREGFPEDAWTVDATGKVRYGLFCCTSPFARDYGREKAKATLAALRPDAYWPDDDLRLFNKIDWSRPSVCFCDRCLDLFGRRYGHACSREGLLKLLNGPDASAEVRRDWCAFNGEVLGEFARIYREAVDAVSPETRLGYQIALSGNCYDGESWKTIVKALSAGDRSVGVRPGGMYYDDRRPADVLAKAILVAREAARSGRLLETAQLCYEAENWPHIGSLKSPGGMMAECALALAAGCDSLALYWGADSNGESADHADFYLETLADWKPFLLSVRDAFRGTVLGGVACFHGENHFATDGWLSHDEAAMQRLAENGFPVTVVEASPDALYLNARSVDTLSSNDLARVFSGAVLMNVPAFQALAKKFPELKFVRKLSLVTPGRVNVLDASQAGVGFESFGSAGRCEVVRAYIRPQSDDVVRLSAMTADPQSCGTCVVPTEFGGKVVVAQDMGDDWRPVAVAGCRRHAILDGLDRAVPGGMPVRLLTDGYAVAVMVRKDAAGRTVGAFLLNLGTGETPPLELAIRRGAGEKWTLRCPKAEPLALAPVRRSGDGAVFRVPSLGPFGEALLAANPASAVR